MAENKYPGILSQITEGDKHQALYRGLLNMGANMGGYSDKPVSFMNQLTQGGQGFAGGYQQEMARRKADYGMDMKAKYQQMQMESQKMAIEKAKQEKAEFDRRKVLAEAFATDNFNMAPGAGEDMGMDIPDQNLPTLDPLTKWQIENDPSAFLSSQVESQNAASVADKKHQQELEIEKLKLSNKDPSMDWALVNGQPKLMPKSQIAAQGLPKYERPRVKSAEELAQDIEVAQASAGAKPITSDQAKSGTFALRMAGATSELSAIASGADGKLGTPDDYVPSRIDTTALELPGGNNLVSDQFRQYRQAQDNWISANLRKESGAVIGVEEMAEERKKYFPQPGDDARTIKQKNAARRTAEAAMKVASGKAFGQMQEELGGNPFAGFKVIK